MLDKESCEVLVCSLVLSHLDYANRHLYGVASYLLKRMQRIQNYVAKVMLQVDKTFNSLQALFELYWLLIKASREYQLLCIIHKCLHDQYSPTYLKDLIVPNRRSGTLEGLRSN